MGNPQGEMNQPDKQGHHVQNTGAVGVQLPDREDLQFLICHRAPGTNTHPDNLD